jgi:type III pantothenate kinase
LPILGKNTVSAMESGIFWGYVSMIEGLLARLRADYGDVSMIATGGLAGLFSGHLSGINAVDPDLTVKGLFEIYARNSSAAARAQDG